MEDMKKMKVNSQVTAIITIIEVLGNLTFMFTWTFITKFAAYTTLLQGMGLYFVILPYAFLMNTSQNKNRIVEEGWVPILKNIFRITIYQPEISDEQNDRNKHAPEENSGKQRRQRRSGNIEENKISTISQASNRDTELDKDVTLSTLNVPMEDFPSTSSASNKYSLSRKMDKSNMVCDEHLDPSTNKTIKDIRQELIKELHNWALLDDEYYIFYLRQFVNFETAVKKGDDTWKSCYKKKYDIDKLVAKFYRDEGIEFAHYKSLGKKDSKEEETVSHRLDHLRKSRNRLEMRQTNLDSLLKHSCKNNEKFQEIFVNFVKMEEDWFACD